MDQWTVVHALSVLVFECRRGAIVMVEPPAHVGKALTELGAINVQIDGSHDTPPSVRTTSMDRLTQPCHDGQRKDHQRGVGPGEPLGARHEHSRRTVTPRSAWRSPPPRCLYGCNCS